MAVEVELKLKGRDDLRRESEQAGRDLATGVQRGSAAVGGVVAGAAAGFAGAVGAGARSIAGQVGTLNDPFKTPQERIAAVAPQAAGAAAGSAADLLGNEVLAKAVGEAVASEVRAALAPATFAAAKARGGLEQFAGTLARAGINMTDAEMGEAFDAFHRIASREAQARFRASRIAAQRGEIDLDSVPSGTLDLLRLLGVGNNDTGNDTMRRMAQSELGSRLTGGE